MDKSWIECHFAVPAAEVDLVADTLYGIGCIGVNVEEKELDTFVVPDPDADLPQAFLVKAYFDAAEPVAELPARICAALTDELPGMTVADITVANLRQEDWAENWKQHFTALRFGERLVVKPTWEEWQAQGDEAIVSLDPGMAFGTGSHETTRLCLQAVADSFDRQPAPETVLDVGTGSGILAIAAATLGARQVVGNEIDADSCRVAAENVAMNGVSGRVEVTTTLLEELDGSFDLVIANILAEENVRLAGELVAHLNEGGTLVLSGILREKERFVTDGFSGFGLTGPKVRYENDWCCILYKKGAA